MGCGVQWRAGTRPGQRGLRLLAAADEWAGFNGGPGLVPAKGLGHVSGVVHHEVCFNGGPGLVPAKAGGRLSKGGSVTRASMEGRELSRPKPNSPTRSPPRSTGFNGGPGLVPAKGVKYVVGCSANVCGLQWRAGTSPGQSWLYRDNHGRSKIASMEGRD